MYVTMPLIGQVQMNQPCHWLMLFSQLNALQAFHLNPLTFSQLC